MYVKLMLMAVAGAMLIIAGVACGGTSNSDKTATAAAKTGTNPPTAAAKAGPTTAASGAGPTQMTITAKDFAFSRDDVDATKGETIAVTFKNAGSASHTLTFFSDDAYTQPIAGADTGSVSAGATKTLTVTADKGLYYRCNIHPTQMQGEIEIK